MAEELPGIHELAEPVLRAHPVTAECRVTLGGLSFRIVSNSADLIGRLADHLSSFADDPDPAGDPGLTVTALEAQPPSFGLRFTDWKRDPGKVGRKDAYADVPGGRVLWKVRTGMQFLLGSGLHVAVGPCLDNDNQVVNFVNALYMTAFLDRGWTLCHAAGVVRDGGGLGLAGVSGAGKSTLALHLVSRGLAFCSNDRLLVREAGGGAAMRGVPKLPRINPGTALTNPDLRKILPGHRRDELEDLDPDDLWDLEEKYDVDVTDVFRHGRIRMTADLRAFVVLAWSREVDAPPEVRRVELRERDDLLSAVAKSPGPFWLPADRAAPPQMPAIEPADYHRVLGRIPVVEVAGGVDFEAACDACLGLLAGQEPA